MKGEQSRRVGDGLDIPEINGELADLVALIGTPLDTPEKQAQAIRDIAVLQLHSYLMHKQNRDDLNAILKERKGIIEKIISGVITPIMYFVLFTILQYAFSTLNP